MTATLNVPMVSLEEAKDVPGALVRIPHIDIDLVVKQVAEVEDYWTENGPFTPFQGLVPPYSGDPGYNARTSSVVRDRFPEHRVYVPMAGRTIKEIIDFMRTMGADGFTNFVFPAEWWCGARGMPFDRIASFIRSEIRKDGFYHLAGVDPMDQIWRPGSWTWSEEEL